MKFLQKEKRLNNILTQLSIKNIDNQNINREGYTTQGELLKKIGISYGVFVDLLENLVDERYVSITWFPNEENVNLKLVTIRDKGREFIKNGGYVRQKYNLWVLNTLKTFALPIIIAFVTTTITLMLQKGEKDREYSKSMKQTELLEKHVFLLDSSQTFLNQRVNHVEQELHALQK